MLKRLKANYGYNHFEIDHTHHVWHCKIAVSSSASMPVIPGVRVESVNITRKGKDKNMLVLSYCTMEWSEHDRMQKALTLFLEEHAINMVKRKYAWVHEEPIPSEQELSFYDEVGALLDVPLD